jgi:Cys-tRNA(Pro)/Cys-tRNA(Cys) deacylase
MFDNTILEKYLNGNKVWYKIHEKETTVHTADAAAKTGISLERITKSLVCLTKDSAIVCIIPGNCRLDTKKVEKIVEGKVRICPFEEAHKYSGYDPGATPPCCYENIGRVIVDKKVLGMETTFGGGGTNKSLLEIKPGDIVRLNKALVEDITQ